MTTSTLEVETITPTSHEHWLALRAENINSSEVAALFGLHPYTTARQLWEAKSRGRHEDLPPSERMEWGNRLEPIVGQAAAERLQVRAEPWKVYQEVAALRLGSSYDWRILGDGDEAVGLLEVKTVDRRAWDAYWHLSGDVLTAAPDHIELQVQHQMLVSGLPRCVVAVLVGGNELRLLAREADPAIGERILEEVEAFWRSVHADEPPDWDFGRDADAIKALYTSVRRGATLQAADQPGLPELLAEYAETKRDVATLERQAQALKAEILTRICDCERVDAPFGSLDAGVTAASPGTLITPEMVGTYINARPAYRRFTWRAAKNLES